MDCREELATSFCHSVLGATEGRKLALQGAGAQNLHLSWERPLGSVSASVTCVPTHRKGCVKDIFPLHVTSDQNAGDPLLSECPYRQASPLIASPGCVFPAHLPTRVSQASAWSFSSPYHGHPLNAGVFRGPLVLAGMEVGVEGATGDHQPLFFFLRSFISGPIDGENEAGREAIQTEFLIAGSFSLSAACRCSHLVNNNSPSNCFSTGVHADVSHSDN